MIQIAHRGNYVGKNEEFENTPAYIESALRAGYHAEVDVWLINKQWFLGHDGPTYLVDLWFLKTPKLWLHAKNIEAYFSLYDMNVHVFWHDKDDFIYTSKGVKWANVGVITHDGIVVMPEYSAEISAMLNSGKLKPLGICSDNFSLFGLDGASNKN
jgi:hypothetical protein